MEDVQYRIPITNLVNVKITTIDSKIEDGEEEKNVALNNKYCLRVDVPGNIRFQFNKVYFVLNGNYNYKRPKEQKLFKRSYFRCGANGRCRRREILDFSF